MEFLFEVVVWVGQLVLEFLLQLLFEGFAEIGLEFFKKSVWSSKPVRPLWALIGYIILGGLLGGVSLPIFPHRIAVPMWLQVANIVISPLILGAAMVGLGRWRTRRNQPTILLHKLWFRLRVDVCVGTLQICWVAV